MARTGIQLYTLRTVDQSLPELLELVADIGFDGVEFANGIHGADLDAVIETVDKTGLTSIGGHETLDPLETELEDTLSPYEALGSRHVTCPWLGPEHFESYDAVWAAADRIETVAGTLDERDLRFHYHNHDHEFVELDGGTGFDAFLEGTTIPIELDIGHALAGGDDPIARIDSLGDRAELLHITDYDASSEDPVPIGHGDIDLAALDDAVTRVKPEWLIYEFEGEDPVETLDDAVDVVRDLC